jgi:MOSC domain-containing protein YiiM
MGSVISIVYTPRKQAARPQDRYVRVRLESARLTEDRGIEGDAKARPGVRQINVMCAEVLDQLNAEGFKTESGEMGEQIVIRGIPAESLVPGAQLRLGEATLEVMIPRTGCERFERIQGKSRKCVEGRLGMLAKVLTGGIVREGDPVELLIPHS